MLKTPVASMALIRQLLIMAAVLTLPISPLLSGNVYASPPDTIINSGPTDPSADTTPVFTFSSTDSPVTFECYIDSNSPAPCSSPYTTTPLTSGPHRFTVQAINASNETDLSPAYIIWSVAAYDGGDGSAGDPYQVSTCSQLQTLESNLSASFVLTHDIDCAGHSFRPIGVNGDPFAGSFDGQGHTIKNLDITGHDDDLGLFGLVSGSGPSDRPQIKNFAVKDSAVSGAGYVGSVVGVANSADITNVRVSNTTVTATGDKVGGLVGSLGGASIASSSFIGAVSSDGSQVGGLAGYLVGPANISDSYARADVGGTNDVGGLVGYADSGTQYLGRSYAITNFTTSTGNRGELIAYIFQEVYNVDNFAVTNISGTMANGDAYKNTTTYGPLASWSFGYGHPWHLNHSYPEHFSFDDEDGDGVSNADEDAAPNSGDANNDGTQDNQQPNVVSSSGVAAGKTVVVSAPACNEVSNLQVGNEPDSHKDVAYDYPSGLAGFLGLGCGVAGVSVPVTIDFYGDYDVSQFVLRKASSSGYSAISGANYSNLTIAGRKVLRVTYVVVDGGPLDADGQADGNISDPVGLALNVVGAPNTGLERESNHVFVW